MNFNELNIDNRIKKALEIKGFSEPSEIQEKVIPKALSGKDIFGKAKTGTGKTAAFGIPIIEKAIAENKTALIVTPTRELALQVKDEIASIAKGTGIKAVAVFGGQNINRQIHLIQKEPNILVGTPGRLLDLVRRKALYLNSTEILVLDEVDKMFDMGFREDVEQIINLFPKDRQTMLFSATMPREIEYLINKHLKQDKLIFDLSTDNAPVEEIDQFYVSVDPKQKISALKRILEKENSKTLIFCRTKRTVDWLEKQLSRRGVKAIAIHGSKSQNSRLRIIDKFKTSKGKTLVATDVVARGIHVDDIDNVINFDFPEESETYIHRIGRTARQGKKGRAISFCTNVMEIQNLEKIGNLNNTEIHKMNC